MYSYLATLRLHEGDGGRTLTVGPKRRVVFRDRIISPKTEIRKDDVKRVLSPLKQYWGIDEQPKNLLRERDPDRPLMSFSQFKGAAKRLLTEAGMLQGISDDDQGY